MPAARHHTVSAFLLDRFARDTSTGRRVCMLDKQSGRPTSVSPRDATVRRHFYSLDVEDGRRDPAIEGVLSVIESIAAPLVRQLDDGDLPVREHRLELALFLAVCWMRTPAWREQMASVMEQMTAAMIAETYRLDPASMGRALAATGSELTTPEEVEEFRLRVVDDLENGRLVVEFPKNRLIRDLLEGAQGAQWTMFLLDWTLVRLEGVDEFVLGDNPVSLYDPKPAFPGGGSGLLSSPFAQLFTPIGPRSGLLIGSNPEVWRWARDNLEALHKMTDEERASTVDKLEGPWAEGVATSEFARELNLRSYAAAERYIFGSQRTVQAVRAMRTSHAGRLAQLAPRGPRMHMVEDDESSASGLRITKTFAPKPRV
jgi:hypothetical protein